MPLQDFFLDSTRTQRIQVHWNSDASKATLLLKSSIFGSLTTADELAGGKDFRLPDGSILHVRLVNNQPQAFRNGFPLATAPAIAESAPLYQRKRGGCLTAWIIMELVLIGLATLSYTLDFLASIATGSSNVSPLVFLVLALLGLGGITGLSLLLAWKKVGFYLAAMCVAINFALSSRLGLFNGNSRTFIPLIGITIIYYWLRRREVWKRLT